MFDSNRAGAIAFALGVLFLAVFWFGIWSGNTDNQYGSPEYEAYQQANPYSEEEARRLGVVPLGSAKSYQEICADPTSHDEADLCQQWRSANAARDSAKYARWQFWLGFLGTIGVGVTVFYAVRTYRLTITTGKAELRAYITARTGGIVEFSPSRFAAMVLFDNDGQTPAHQVRSIAVAYIVNNPMMDFDEEFILKSVAQAIPIERTNSVSRGRGHSTNVDFVPTGDFLARHSQVVAGQYMLVIAGRIEYVDVFGDEHTTNFYHIYPPGAWGADDGLYHAKGNNAD